MEGNGISLGAHGRRRNSTKFMGGDHGLAPPHAVLIPLCVTCARAGTYNTHQLPCRAPHRQKKPCFSSFLTLSCFLYHNKVCSSGHQVTGPHTEQRCIFKAPLPWLSTAKAPWRQKASRTSSASSQDMLPAFPSRKDATGTQARHATEGGKGAGPFPGSSCFWSIPVLLAAGLPEGATSLPLVWV